MSATKGFTRLSIWALCGAFPALLACGKHESRSYGFRDAGDVRRVEADNSAGGRFREAIRSGDVTAINLALGEGAQVNSAWPDGRTPIIEAVISNQPEVVELLLKKGADPNVADRDGLSALDHAKDRPQILRILVPPGAEEIELLFSAVRGEQVEELRDLLAEGADPNAADRDGETLLTFAIKSGFDAVVKTLLQDERTDASLKNKQGESPLFLARKAGLRRVEKMLLQRGAEA